MVKRKVEVFSAGCPVCRDAVKLVQELACEQWEVVVYDLSCGCASNEGPGKAAAYGIARVPAVVIDGKLVQCCQSQEPVSRELLLAAGVGRCCI
ncbi:MAG: thioredoxin family protein [Bacillota bacterium]